MWNNDDKGAMRQPLLSSSSTSHGPHVVNDLHDRVELAHHVDDGDAQRDGHSASQRDGHSAWVGGGSDSSKGTCEVSSAPFCLHTLHTDTVAAVHLPQSHRTSPIGTLQYICIHAMMRNVALMHCICMSGVTRHMHIHALHGLRCGCAICSTSLRRNE
jgi:hypothetical protein